MLSTLGGGLLIGTALIVILPEGVDTLYALQSDHVHKSHNDAHTHQSDHTDFHAHGYIGPTLALGFLFMFIIDQIGHASHTDHHHYTPPLPTSVPSQEDTIDGTVESVSYGATDTSIAARAATLGLVVHSAAEGIAVGAATASGQSSLSLIVFLAIILHKAPASLGLCSFLMKADLPKSTIKRHIFSFSISAPLTAILTFFVLTMFLNTDHGQDMFETSKWSALLLLFSAGTFLYVATVHVIPQVYEQLVSSTANRHMTVHSERERWINSALFLLGMFSPMVFNLGHVH